MRTTLHRGVPLPRSGVDAELRRGLSVQRDWRGAAPTGVHRYGWGRGPTGGGASATESAEVSDGDSAGTVPVGRMEGAPRLPQPLEGLPGGLGVAVRGGRRGGRLEGEALVPTAAGGSLACSSGSALQLTALW